VRILRMFFSVWVSLLICGGSLFAFDPGMPTVPWFDFVNKPMHLPSDQGRLFCRELRQALLAGNSLEQIEQIAPKDPNPRVIFISLGDGIWPERTYFGAGFNFSTALLQALAIMRVREPNYAEIITARLKKDIAEAGSAKVPESWQEKLKKPDSWTDLRLDIVQNALPINDFSIRRSRIQLTSLNGIAFRPSEGFAFTAEQMMGRYLITQERFLNERQVGDFIAETTNWDALKTWLKMANSEQEGRVCLFEYDSYFVSPSSSKRLFRGHPMQTGAGDIRPLELATKAGKRILQNLDDDGTLRNFFPEWQPSRHDGREFLSCRAELAIAFARLGKDTGEKAFSDAARKVVKDLLKSSQGSKDGKSYRYVLEAEDLSVEEKLQDPRLLINMHTNALVCLALLESGLPAESDEYLLIARDLVAWLTRQQQRDGSFVCMLVHPTMQRPLEDFFSDEAKMETAALAALAIAEYARLDKSSEAVLRQRHALALDNLLAKLQAENDLRSLPLSPWLAELLCGKEQPSPEYIMQNGRLAIAAGLDIDRAPAFPDLFGVPRNLPSMTVAAEHTWILAVISEWLFRQGEKNPAHDFLSDAWPLWVFQQQAIMEEASAAPLPRPNLYYHLMRDHLEDFGFDLNGQTTQILSMLNIDRCLQNIAGQNFPKQPADLEAWQKAWQMIDHHPFCLDPALVRKGSESSSSRHSVGSLERGQKVTVKAKGGKIVAAEPAVSGKIIERKTRTGRRNNRR
jgi:hypothetical protein